MTGGLYLALSTEPQSTVTWAQGARGERLLGAYLEKLPDDATVIVLRPARARTCRKGVGVDGAGEPVPDPNDEHPEEER